MSRNTTDLKREHEVLHLADVLYRRNPTWVEFFREVLGWDGMVMQAFSTPDERAAFQQTPEYTRLCGMLEDLRRRSEAPAEREPTSTITVRLPRTVHESLLREAADAGTSLNRLCVAKLTGVLLGPVQGEDEQEGPTR